MRIFGPILISVIISILYGSALLVYFNFEEVKNGENFKNKLQKVFTMDMKTKWIILIAVISGVIFFIIETIVYKKDIINSLRWQIAGMLLLPIGYIDFKEQIIPNIILLIGLIFTLPLLIIQMIIIPEMTLSIISSAFVGAFVASGIFFIASLLVKNGVGAGDIKMYFVLGLLVGFVGIFNILLYSMIISAITGVVLITMKKKSSKDVLPLAPFTLIGVILAILLGV